MIDIVVPITQKQLDALSDGEQIQIILVPPKKEQSRKDAIKAELPHRMSQLIDAWNLDPYIRIEAASESRNNKFPMDQLPAFRGIFTRALTEIGMGKIQKAMSEYFTACRNGEHIWEGKNHGYSHLGGFIKRLLSPNTKPPFWRGVHDEHPQDTRDLADAYAKRFLGRPAYGELVASGKEYGKFMATAGRILRLSEKTGMYVEDITTMLLDCVAARTESTGVLVSPGWLGNDGVWKNDLPQKLKKLS